LISKQFLLCLGGSHRRFKGDDLGLKRGYLLKELSEQFAGFSVGLSCISQGGFVDLLLARPASAQVLLLFLHGSHFLLKGLECARLNSFKLRLGAPLKGNGQEGT